jgi:hypothetical protein
LNIPENSEAMPSPKNCGRCWHLRRSEVIWGSSRWPSKDQSCQDVEAVSGIHGGGQSIEWPGQPRQWAAVEEEVPAQWLSLELRMLFLLFCTMWTAVLGNSPDESNKTPFVDFTDLFMNKRW